MRTALNASNLKYIQLKVKVIPNSSRNQITGWLHDMLKIKINAPAKKGKANKELIKFLAKQWNIRKSAILIEKGMFDRIKVLRIQSNTPLPLPAKPLRLL